MPTQELIIKLIKLLKPEFYNKITWAVVIAGLALMATPFWEEILLAILKKEYELNLAPGGNTPWGFALVVIGLIYHLASNSILQVIEYKNRKKKEGYKLKHDSNVFKASQEILSEKFLNNYFDWLLGDHSYRTNDRYKLHEYTNYHLSQENRFINNELQSSATNLSRAIIILLDWISLNFWIYPERQTGENTRYCMQPHWNVDRAGNGKKGESKKYREASEKLSALSKEVNVLYKTYRHLVKNKLFI